MHPPAPPSVSQPSGRLSAWVLPQSVQKWLQRGLFFSFIYWGLESLRCYILEAPTETMNVLWPSPIHLWARGLMIGFILLFSLWVPRVQRRLQNQEATSPRFALHYIAASLVLAVIYWVSSTIQHQLLATDGPSLNLINWTHSAFWMRFEAVFVLLFFGTYAQSLINHEHQRSLSAETHALRLQQLLFDLPYPVCMLNGALELTVANPAFKNIFATHIAPKPNESRREAATRFLNALNLNEGHRSVLAGETVFFKDIQIQSPSQPDRGFECSAFPVHDEQGLIYRIGLLWRETTEQQQAESENRRLQSELMHVQKMDAIGMLAGGIAHDFNNLITAIQGSAEMAMMDVAPQSSPHEDLRQIQLASERAANLTRQLLLFSRKHPMQKTTQSLNTLIEELLKMLHRLVGEPIAMHMKLAPDLWPAKLDRGTLEQAIVNLVVNARNAMPDGGRITLSTLNIPAERAKQLHTEAKPPVDTICLVVEDTGLGMPQETMAHIFEPFYTTRKGEGGTGLGLSVVHGIVKQHDGWLKVFSHPGRGTRFELYFPAHATIETPPVYPSQHVPMPEGHGECILVVEDDASVRRFTAGALKRHGYKIIEAENADSARKIFEDRIGHVHLLLSDLVLPDYSGLDLAQSLMQADDHLKCILGSGYFDREHDEKTSANAAIHFLRKPYDLKTLVSTVHQVLTQ